MNDLPDDLHNIIIEKVCLDQCLIKSHSNEKYNLIRSISKKFREKCRCNCLRLLINEKPIYFCEKHDQKLLERIYFIFFEIKWRLSRFTVKIKKKDGITYKIPMLTFDISSFADALDEPIFYYMLPDNFTSMAKEEIKERFLKQLYDYLELPYLECADGEGINVVLLCKYDGILDRILNFTKFYSR